jgi:hypothetical protein
MSEKASATLDTLKFDNSFIRELPSDPVSEKDKVSSELSFFRKFHEGLDWSNIFLQDESGVCL